MTIPNFFNFFFKFFTSMKEWTKPNIYPDLNTILVATGVVSINPCNVFYVSETLHTNNSGGCNTQQSNENFQKLTKL